MSLLDRKCIPDFDGLKNNLLRKKPPQRVYFMECFQDEEIRDAVAEKFGLTIHLDRNEPFYDLKKEIAIQSFLGYEMILPRKIALSFPIQRREPAAEHAMVSSDPVAVGPIQSWKDFDSYPWPKPSDLDVSDLEWLEKNLPENMKCYCLALVGLYKMLIGYEAMFFMMYDQPELMLAIINKLKEIFVEFCGIVSQFSCVGVIWGSDDMGHKTQTFFPPEFIKENILPLHKACADAAHKGGKMYFLHSCGNLEKIMDALIESVHIDAKHSFEDVIVPIEEMKGRYGQRVALIGGFDVDFLCRGSEMAIRNRVRDILKVCQPGGGYCLGSGNSIAKYVPLDNYLYMLDEGRRWDNA